MAILRNGEKYACLTCIKGHRVAGCNHNDRDLVLVRRRGRPSTQCEHCRRLRTSSRKVHTKCTCGSATASTNDSMYNGDENNGINSNADNIYYAGVATNNQINNQVNNQVNNVETKSIVSRCKCGCSENCRCCSVILSVPALLNPCDCRERGTECVNCRTVVPLTFEQAAAEGHIDPNCRCGKDQFGDSCCSGGGDGNDTIMLQTISKPLLSTNNAVAMTISNSDTNMATAPLVNATAGGCCSSKPSPSPSKGGCCSRETAKAPSKGGCCSTKLSKPTSQGGCCSTKEVSKSTSKGGCCSSKSTQQPSKGGCCGSKVPPTIDEQDTEMTDTDNLSKCDGCGPNGCACSTNEHHTNNNDYPMPRPVDLSQSHSSNFSETASSNYSHYSDTSKSSFGQITSYSPTADMDMSDQYPPTKRQRSDELGDEELMRMVYNTVTSMPSTSQCGCSSGGGCGAGCGQGCKGCNMPTSATSTSSADAMNQETSGGCCSPDNGCNSTIGNPRRPPYRNIKGELTCSCGCEKASQDCTDCFEDLCEEYLLKPPI